MFIFDVSLDNPSFTFGAGRLIKRLFSRNNDCNPCQSKSRPVAQEQGTDGFSTQGLQTQNGADLTEEDSARYKRMLEETLPKKKAELLDRLLNATVGNADDEVIQAINNDLKKVEGRGRVAANVLGIKPTKINLPEEAQDKFKNLLEALSKKKASLVKQLTAAVLGNADEAVIQQIQSELAKTDAVGGVLKKALGLPAGEVELPKESQDEFKNLLETLSKKKASLVKELANNADEAAIQQIQDELAKVDAVGGVLKKALGLNDDKTRE